MSYRAQTEGFGESDIFLRTHTSSVFFHKIQLCPEAQQQLLVANQLAQRISFGDDQRKVFAQSSHKKRHSQCAIKHTCHAKHFGLFGEEGITVRTNFESFFANRWF